MANTDLWLWSHAGSSPIKSKRPELPGKGGPEFWVAVVKPGRILFEIEGVSEELAREAIRLAGHKLPCKTKFVKKESEPVKEGGEKDEN